MSTITTTTTTTQPITIPPTRRPAEHLLAAMRSMLDVNPWEQVFDLIRFIGTSEAIDPVGEGPDGDITEAQGERCQINAFVLADHVARAFVAMGAREATELATYVRDRLWSTYRALYARNPTGELERAALLDIRDLERAFALPLPSASRASVIATAAKEERDVDRWDAAGRTLRELDPEAFRAALALVQTMATKAGAS